MPSILWNGEPGDTWVNTTDKCLYQFICEWRNSCAACIGLDHAIGFSWPIPLHHSCRCRQLLLRPGAESRPFVDFRAKILELPDSQRAKVMGVSNLKLVESGVVEWTDVVSHGRIRDLREVVSHKKLSVKTMVAAGVPQRTAEEAYKTVHTAAHDLAAETRDRVAAALRAKGLSDERIKQLVGERLAGRLTVGGGPGGPPAAPPAAPPTPTPPAAPKGPSQAPRTPPPAPKPLPPDAIEKALGVKIKPATEAAPKKAEPTPKVAPLTGEQIEKASLPTAKPPPRPSYGLSKAVFGKDVEDDDTVEERTKSILGMRLDRQKLATLAGSPHNSRVNIEFGENEVIVEWVLLDKDGRPYKNESTAERRFAKDPVTGKIVARNVAFLLPEGYKQGTGLGAEVFGRQVEILSRLGADRIETEATRRGEEWVGYKVWPKFGYDGPIPERVLRDLPDSLAGARTIQDLYATKEGQKWWEENGATFDGTFDLKAGSKSRQAWDDYLRAKEEQKNPTSATKT